MENTYLSIINSLSFFNFFLSISLPLSHRNTFWVILTSHFDVPHLRNVYKWLKTFSDAKKQG